MCLLIYGVQLEGADPFRESRPSNAPVRNAVSWSTSSCSPVRCFCGRGARFEVARARRVRCLDGAGQASRRSGAVRIATPSGCETPAGEACAAPASFVWRFQAALNAFWVAGAAGPDDKSGGFLVGSALGHGGLVDE